MLVPDIDTAWQARRRATSLGGVVFLSGILPALSLSYTTSERRQRWHSGSYFAQADKYPKKNVHFRARCIRDPYSFVPFSYPAE